MWKVIAPLVGGAIGLIVIVTIMRGAPIDELLKKYYRYTCGNTVLLDYHINRLNSNNILSLSFGGLFGFWSFILPIFHKIGLAYPTIYLDCINEVMVGQNFVEIGTDMYTNAFLSSFYHVYADFRIFGVIVGMLAFGIFCSFLYRKAITRKTPLFMVMYLIASQMIFKTLQEYFLSSAQYFLPILAIVLIMVIYSIKSRNGKKIKHIQKGFRKKDE